MNPGWIILWYAFCVLMGIGNRWFYDILNRPRFRDDYGETTEAGYEEDSIGRPYHDPDDQCLDPEIPHVEPIGGSGMGAL